MTGTCKILKIRDFFDKTKSKCFSRHRKCLKTNIQAYHYCTACSIPACEMRIGL